jgi:hypothetical protein
VRQVNLTISLAFLAPDLVKAAVEGRLPRGIGVERLRDAPAEWSRQFETLGLIRIIAARARNRAFWLSKTPNSRAAKRYLPLETLPPGTEFSDAETEG